jgi:type IV pilus assembly protein PilW
MRSYNISRGLKSQRGLTLVELMIAITIGLILLVGVFQIYLGSRQTYRVQDNMARLQENGRFAMNFLARDLRTSDHWGCLKDPVIPASSVSAIGLVNQLTNAPNSGFLTGIEGTSGATSAIPDTITLAGAMPTGIYVTIPMPTAAAVITVNSNVGLVNGEIVLISDCLSGDVFQITSLPGTNMIQHNSGGGTPGNTFTRPNSTCPGGATNCFHGLYGPGAEILRPQAISYSIAPDPANNNRPTLFRSTTSIGVAANPQPLVEGVEDMQILYGEDLNTDFSADRYVAAGTAGLLPNRIVSIRISLVMVTNDNNLASIAQTYINANGESVTATDRRLRRVFSSTIQLRNRV